MERSSTNLQGHGLRDLVRWMSRRRKRQLALLFVLMLAGALAELLAIGAVLPFLRLIVAPGTVLASPRLAGLRAAFDWHSPADLVVPAAVLLVGTAIVAAAVRLLLAWATQRFAYRLSYDMDTELFRRTIGQPYAVHVHRNSSATLAGFDKIQVLSTNLLLPVMSGIASAVIAFFVIVLLFAIDAATATITATTVGTIYLIIAVASRHLLRDVSQRRAWLAGARIKAVQEGLGGLRDIILDRSQPVHERRFAAISDPFRDLGARAAIVAAAPRFVVEGAGVALIGLLAIYLSGRPGGVLAAVPVLGALALGAQRLIPLLQASYQAVIQYLAMRHSLADVLALMKAPMLTPPAPLDSVGAPVFRHSVTLVDAEFRYGEEVALAGVDLVIARGERVGLVGVTGSGKSTLVDLLMGLLQPAAGMLLVDGEPLTPERTARWQAQIAHVPQSIFLVDDTLAVNIALSETGAIDMARVEDAARRAQIHDFAAGLAQGYATTVGERGVRLSGGQRQRIGIARALYKRADVLVLDEATSALDERTEARVMAAIDAPGQELTIITIAHRWSTLRACDTVYRVEGGRLTRLEGQVGIVSADRPA